MIFLKWSRNQLFFLNRQACQHTSQWSTALTGWKNHCRTFLNIEIYFCIMRNHPLGIAVFVAFVTSKESRYPSSTEICRSVFLGSWHDNRISDDKTILVHATLEVTEQQTAIGRMIWIVTKSLYHINPRRRFSRSPSSIGIKFFKIRNHGFNQSFFTLSSWTRCKGPNSWFVEPNLLVDDFIIVEAVDNSSAFATTFSSTWKYQIWFFKDTARYEDFANTFFAGPFSFIIFSFVHVFESTFCINIIHGYYCCICIIFSCKSRHHDPANQITQKKWILMFRWPQTIFFFRLQMLFEYIELWWNKNLLTTTS